MTDKQKTKYLEEYIQKIHDRLVRFAKNFPDFRRSPAFQCLLADLNVLIFTAFNAVDYSDYGK